MKYIVYLTTNLKSNVNGIPKIYIGVHKVKDENVFDGYIGCGVWINIPTTYMYPKTPFQCAVKKYGPSAFIRQTLYVFSSKEEAFQKEEELVTREFIKQPHVYNASLGGVAPGFHYKALYQFDLEGNLKHKWELSIEASDYYGYPSVRFFRASRERSSFLDSFWSTEESIDIKNYKIVGIQKQTYIYSKEGKLLEQFDSEKECADYLQIKSVIHAIKRQSLVQGKYYISNILTDTFIPKPRLQYNDLTYYIYDKSGKLLAEKYGKEAMKFLGINSWRYFKDILTYYKGWRKDLYISTEKIDKVPVKEIIHSQQVDVYDKFGNFIETVDSIKETKIKYNLNSGKLRRLDRQDCYTEDYVFKFHRISSK